MPNQYSSSFQSNQTTSSSPDFNLSVSERAFAAAGAAFLSAVIVNPLDVAKTRLQAQAASVPYQNLHSTCRFEPNTKYKGTLDVFQKVIHEEGFSRLWRGTNASLALAVPTLQGLLPVHWLVLLVTLLNLQELVCRHLKMANMEQSFLECGRRQLGLFLQTQTPRRTLIIIAAHFVAFDSYGRVLGHNYLVMFHFLRFAGLPWNQ